MLEARANNVSHTPGFTALLSMPCRDGCAVQSAQDKNARTPKGMIRPNRFDFEEILLMAFLGRSYSLLIGEL